MSIDATQVRPRFPTTGEQKQDDNQLLVRNLIDSLTVTASLARMPDLAAQLDMKLGGLLCTRRI